MTNRVDLHLHSTASDGVHTPAELVQMSLELGLRFISLTDHDTTGGIDEAIEAARGTELTVIPGVEMSAHTDGAFELHILGYYIDTRCQALQERLSALRQSRLGRAHRVLDVLSRNGLPISWDRVSELADGGSIGRPHIAQAMVEAEYVESVDHAFRRYLGRTGIAYVPRDKLDPEEAVQLILEARGVPVLAHPGRVIEYIPGLVRAGLKGLEVYYNDYLEPEVRFLAGLARKHGLVATGGTDYHGDGITTASAPGARHVPLSAVEALREAAERVGQGDPRR
ncbi:MAG: PHP domain-containing protein [Anaerolineae bacterium]|nr:PHP domain-containing protein [Anaerolineae bacterium]